MPRVPRKAPPLWSLSLASLFVAGVAYWLTPAVARASWAPRPLWEQALLATAVAGLALAVLLAIAALVGPD